jgi:large subunit ribosomal protein L25
MTAPNADTSKDPNMAEVKLVAEPREGTGKGVARKLRAAGRVPAVLYGAGLDSTPVSVDSKDLFHVLHTGAGYNVLVDLKLDGNEHLVIPRDVQRDHIHGRFIHLDLLAVRRDETIKISVPIQIVGESVGVKAGGVVEHHLWEIEVECLPQDVPDAIEADITELEIGMGLRVSDLQAPAGVTFLTNEEESVVAVAQPQMAVELEEEEAAEGEEGVEGEAAEGEGAEGVAEGGEGEGAGAEDSSEG